MNNEEIEILDEDTQMIEVDDNESIETLDDFTEAPKVVEPKVQENSVISLDTLFQTNDDVIDVSLEKEKKDEKKQKKITRVQIGLIIFLVIFASLFYFFGYDLVEPYIKID
ncbi:MAG: hypothetical protein J6J17_00945 [Bacilli bacterium]|nr:hypothetical protein [Bacilli bacterium]